MHELLTCRSQPSGSGLTSKWMCLQPSRRLRRLGIPLEMTCPAPWTSAACWACSSRHSSSTLTHLVIPLSRCKSAVKGEQMLFCKTLQAPLVQGTIQQAFAFTYCLPCLMLALATHCTECCWRLIQPVCPWPFTLPPARQPARVYRPGGNVAIFGRVFSFQAL